MTVIHHHDSSSSRSRSRSRSRRETGEHHQHHTSALSIILQAVGALGRAVGAQPGRGSHLQPKLVRRAVYGMADDFYRAIDGANGELVQALSYPPTRHVHLNPEDVGLVMEGIHDAASEPGGTSAAVWTGWNQAQHPVYGKTGTAQHEANGEEDQSWYMCYLPDPARPIVIAVTVEQGGFGAETAAPILASRLIIIDQSLAAKAFPRKARNRPVAHLSAERPRGRWPLPAAPGR